MSVDYAREPNLQLLWRQGSKLQRQSVDDLITLPGRAPAIMLVNPKYPHNVGAVVRSAACYGLKQVWMTGRRVSLEPDEGKGGYRLPREERMRDYAGVSLFNYDYVFDMFSKDHVTPVAVEVRPNSEFLPDFVHPENPLYIFGPEDGGLGASTLHLCHRFVTIPTKHCLNLSAAVNTVLYDRLCKTRKFS